MHLRLGTLVLLAQATTVLTLSANVNVLRHYRLGENDPGAAPGSSATTLSNSVAGPALTVSGSATYSSVVVSNNFNTSVLSLNFNGTSVASNSAILNVTDNFGVEAWVKPGVISGSHCLAYNGNTGSDGWGLFQNGNEFRALFGGVTFFGSHPVDTNVWTHLALVRASDLATFYVNGLPVASVTNAPNLPNGVFALGGVPLPSPSELYDGLLDDVRVFTFDPGLFSRNDLLFPPLNDRQLLLTHEPEPNLIRLAWPASQLNTTLRSTTNLNLPSWSEVPHFYSNGLFHAVQPVSSPANFYQVAECNLRPASVMTLKAGANPATTLLLNEQQSAEDLYVYTGVQLRNNQTLILDFSQSITADVCRTNDLTYHWTIEYDDTDVTAPYRVAGITGYDTPTLHIAPHSMIRTSNGNFVRITLTIERAGTWELTRCSLVVVVTDSFLTLAQFNTCQTDPDNCTNPNALPVPEDQP